MMGSVWMSQQSLLMYYVTCLSVKCSKENECFAACVGMAVKYLVYWGKINLLIDNVAVGLVPRWSD